MKKLISIVLVSIIAFGILNFNAEACNLKYGVFTGASISKVKKLTGYNEIVVDASYYKKEDIDYLHKKGMKVYSYINIGSIESFRDYYNSFVNITLGAYENWEDERWIDVSNTKWQNYVVNVIAKGLADKNIDGFFIDNVDVYSNYKNDKIFNGVYSILTKLKKQYNKYMIVNGGYDFFTKAMEKGYNLTSITNAVNLESIYTSIDFDNNKYIVNDKNTVNDAMSYINLINKKGLKIYIIEYSNNTKITNDVKKFYNKYDYNVYISKSKDLN